MQFTASSLLRLQRLTFRDLVGPGLCATAPGRTAGAPPLCQLARSFPVTGPQPLSSLWRAGIRASRRASPSAPQLLAFSPGKEQAAGVWETCLAPGWHSIIIITSTCFKELACARHVRILMEIVSGRCPSPLYRGWDQDLGSKPLGPAPEATKLVNCEMLLD